MRRPRTIAVILTLLILLVFELTILPLIEVGGVKPDLLLVSVCFFGLQWGAGFGLAVGLISGLLKDCFSQGLVGGYAFCLGLLGLVVGHHGRLLYRESLLTQAVVTFLASGLALFLYHSFSRLYQPMPSIGSSLRWMILPASIYTAIMALPTFFLLQKIFGITKRR